MLSSLVAYARQAGVDQAAAFALISRLWQLAAAPITLLVIAARFTPEVQGYYYTFISLLALQSFVELGMSVVIINVASHEWSRLSIDATGHLAGEDGAMSRLVSFGRLVFKWYAVAGLLFVSVVGPLGFWFFAGNGDAAITWRAPWVALIVLTGLQLSLLAYTALLEGCNQVATVQKFRVVQAVVSTSVFWLSATGGAGLWAAVAVALVRLATDGYLVGVRYGRFFSTFRRQVAGPTLSWSNEVWPMQWRLGVSGIVNYFAFSLFTPVMFAYHGAATAGRMGMTMQLVGGVQALALVFLTTRVPQFGMLVARRDYQQLEPLWRRASFTSLAVLAAGGGAVLALVACAQALDLRLAARVLGTVPTGLLVCAALLMQVSQCQTAYIRAHRRELIMIMSVTTSLAIGGLVYLLGRRFGPTGALASYLAVTVVIVVWEAVILRRFKASLQVPAEAVS